MKRYSPPSLSATEARARGLLARHGHGIALGALQLSLDPQPLQEPPARWDAAWRLQLEWSGARGTLRLSEPTLRRLLEAQLGADLELPPLPPAQAALALQQGFAAFIAPLAAAGRGLPRLVELEPEREPEAMAHRIALRFQLGGETLMAELGCDALGLMLLAGLLAARPAVAEALPELPLPLRAVLGRTRLPLAALRQLAPGDLLLMDEAWLAPHAEGGEALRVGCGGGALWTARRQGTDLWFSQPMKDEEPMDDEPQSDTPVALDALPVTLRFELGLRTLSLAELQALRPGVHIDLGLPPTQAVQLRANGALVGEGELVEVDGRLGVSVTRVGSLP
jgi:type III secretion protein Q